MFNQMGQQVGAQVNVGAGENHFRVFSAYMVIMTFTQGSYWPETALTWASGVLAGEPRTGAQILADALQNEGVEF